MSAPRRLNAQFFRIGALIWALSGCTSDDRVAPAELIIQSEVILNQIISLNPESSIEYPPFFLAEGSETKNQEPVADLLALVQGSYERISPISKGELQKDRKIKDPLTGTEGVLIWFGPVTWENPETAVVVCGQSYGLHGGEESRFRVRKVGKQWKVLDRTVLWVR